MIKFSSTDDFNFGVEPVEIIKEPKQLEKVGSSKELLKWNKTPGQTDVHVIALGAGEGTGSNRNSDWFGEKDCEANHHYFSDADRAVNRNHKNKKTDPKYGNIKASAYNKKMKRVELMLGLDDDKCGDILGEIESGRSPCVSMASKQEFDKCAWCGHKAKDDKPGSRCEHIPAQLGEINKLGQMCYMDNPNPKWFEISFVKRGADRIGLTLGKIASSYIPKLGSDYLKIYTGFEIPEPEPIILSKCASDKRNLLNKLSTMEKHMDAISTSKPSSSSKGLFLLRQAKMMRQTPQLSSDTLSELRKFDPDKLLKALADHGIVFSPEEFSQYLFKDKVPKEKIEGFKSHLPHAFVDAKDNNEIINDDRFEPSSDSFLPEGLRKLISGLFDGHSLESKPQMKRTMRIMIMSCGKPDKLEEKNESLKVTKEASDNDMDRGLAKQYISYKLAALNYLEQRNKLDEDMMAAVIIQNRI